MNEMLEQYYREIEDLLYTEMYNDMIDAYILSGGK